MTNPPTRTELLLILIHNYEDVLNGLRDSKGTGEHLPLMCAAWNHPAYQQLERCLSELRHQHPNLYWHLHHTHIWGHHQTVMQCPRCETTYRPWNHPGHHTHGRKHITLQPRIIRTRHPLAKPQLATQAIGWINQHWQGPIILPLELQHHAA
jgi:hypothetical protein